MLELDKFHQLPKQLSYLVTSLVLEQDIISERKGSIYAIQKITTKKPVIRSFRQNPKLSSQVDDRLDKNSGINFSTLTNLALRQFITHRQTMEPVETVEASNEEVQLSALKNLKKHHDAIDHLK